MLGKVRQQPWMFPGLECLLELLSLHLYFHCNLCISSRLKCMRCSSQDNETIYMGARWEMSVIWDISLVPSSDNLCPLSSHFISKTVFMYFNCIWLVWRWEGEIDNCYIQLLFPGAVLSSDHLTILEKSGVCQWHGNYIIIPLDWNSPQKETEIFSKTKWNLHSAQMVKTTNMHLSLWCRLSGNKSRLAGLAEAFLLCLDITLSQLWRYARSHVKFMFNVDLKD